MDINFSDNNDRNKNGFSKAGVNVEVELTSSLQKELCNFIANKGFKRETQIDLLNTLLTISKGRILFDTSLKEITEQIILLPKYALEFQEYNAELWKRKFHNLKGSISERLYSLEKWQREHNTEFINILDRDYGGRDELNQNFIPFKITCKFTLLERLANINNSSSKRNEDAIEELKAEDIKKSGKGGK